MALSCIISEIQSEILVQNRDFFHTRVAFDTTSEYCHTVWYRKTMMVSLPESELICITVSTEKRHVTDGQTEILR